MKCEDCVSVFADSLALISL